MILKAELKAKLDSNDVIEDSDIDYSSLESIHTDLKNLLAEEVSENFDTNELLLSAQNFLNIYEKNNTEIANLENQIVRLKQSDAQNPSGKATDLQKRKYRTQQLALLKEYYSAAFAFDDALNKFLYGDSIPKKAIYVYSDSKTGMLHSYEMSLNQMLDMIVYESGIGRFRKGNNIAALSNMEGVKTIEDSNTKDEKWNQKVTIARTAFKAANNRLNRFYEVRQQRYEAGKLGEIKKDKKGNTIKLQKQGGILLWKRKREWTWAQITNAGDLKEGYISMMFEQHAENLLALNNQLGVAPYYSHELIDKYMEYVQGVTNKPAILEEDVVTSVAQYAIKTFKAELPSIKQYIDGAKTVMYFFTKKDFSKKKIASVISQIYDQDASRNTQKEVSGELKDILDSLMKELDK